MLTLMIDTGSNISLIDQAELSRLQQAVSYTHLDVYKRQVIMNTEE